MAATNAVFQRIEKKYRLTPQQRAALIPILEERMELDHYGKSTITSLYLDTPTNDLICRSLEKPLYKEKIRIRRYGAITTMTGNNDVFLEIKKKYKGVVYKRRVRMTWNAACAFLGGMDYVEACRRYPLADPVRAQESTSHRNQQISREICAFAQIHRDLSPSMFVAYDRTALRLRETSGTSNGGAGTEVSLDLSGQGELRITFDDNIRYVDMRSPFKSDRTERLLPLNGDVIMEVKMVGAMPLWLSHSFAELNIRPASFTKFGEAFKVAYAQRKPARGRSVHVPPNSSRGKARTAEPRRRPPSSPAHAHTQKSTSLHHATH